MIVKEKGMGYIPIAAQGLWADYLASGLSKEAYAASRGIPVDTIFNPTTVTWTQTVTQQMDWGAFATALGIGTAAILTGGLATGALALPSLGTATGAVKSVGGAVTSIENGVETVRSVESILGGMKLYR